MAAGGEDEGLARIGQRVRDRPALFAIPEADVEPPPSFGADTPTDFLLGLGKSGGRVKLLLDIDRVLSTADVVQLQATQPVA